MPLYLSPDLHEHPAVTGVSPAAAGLWVRCVSYAAKWRTNGFIDQRLPRDVGGLARLVDELLKAGLWTRTVGGYQVEHHGVLWRETAPKTRRWIPAPLRESVYARDGYVCVRCGSDAQISLDHIYPYSLGGDDSMDNLQTLCMPCNVAKGARVDG